MIRIPLSAIRIPLKEETPNLHSEKEGHFCPCFGHFLASSISDKNEDKVQNLSKVVGSRLFRADLLCQKWIEKSCQNLHFRKLQKAKCEG